jgi:SAM-dependent methyltransferase
MRVRRMLSLASDAAFVHEAYLTILGREADEDGFRYYAGQLASGAMSRRQVLADLQSAPEPHLHKRAPGFFARLRGRSARGTPADAYKYQFREPTMTFEEAVAKLARKHPNTVTTGTVENASDDLVARVSDDLTARGVKPVELVVDVDAYQRYVRQAEYATRYPNYYAGNFAEKAFEHYIGCMLLALQPGQVFVDLASEHSPVPEIYGRLTGCEAYAQDLMFEAGMHGRRIGGDAGAMPVADGFFNATLLTCSIEHFEGAADTRLFQELQRTLAPGGVAVSVPLYLYERPLIQTDPLYAVAAAIQFDADCEIRCVKGWGNRHARFYSPTTLIDRLIRPCPGLQFTVYRLVGLDALDAGVYCRFVLQARRAET